MASYTLKASSAGEKQGWFSTSGSGSNHTITMNFGSAIDSFRGAVDVSNITITAAQLQVNCTASGKDDKKDFKLSVETYGALGTFRTTDRAYNCWAYLNLNSSACSIIKNWIVGDKTYMYSTDPNPSQFGSKSYSTNYVKVTEANLVLTYTVNKSSATLSSTTMNLGKSYNITINAGSTAYTHNIKLIIGSHSYDLATGISGGTSSITIPTGVGTDEMPASKTKNGTLRITTYSGSSNLGDSDYTITVQAGTDCAPSINAISLTMSATPNSSFSGAGKVILNGITSVTFNTSATGKYGATISSYNISGAGLNAENTTGSFTSIITQTGNQTITIIATDSRGYTVSSTKTINITNYSLPSIKDLIIYRCDSSGNRDDVNGKYAKINYSSIITTPITNATSSGTTYNNAITVKVGSTTVTSGSVFGGSYKVDSTYNLTISNSDTVGYSTTITVELPSSSYLLHFRKKQNSIGIGCAGDDLTGSSDNGRLTINWPTYFKNSVNLNSPLGINQGGTGSSSIENFYKNYLFNMIYPVGKIIYTTKSANPSTYLGGGTWTQIKDVFLLAAGSTYSAGSTGGEASHKLTIEESPAHQHTPDPSRGTYNEKPYYFTTNATLGTDEVARRGVSSSSSASGGYAITSTNSGYIYDSPYTNIVGGGQAHNNMPPYKTVYVWERTA